MNKDETIVGLPRVLKLFLLVNASLYLVCVAVKVLCRFVLHLPGPYSQLLTGERFPDFFTVRDAFAYFHHVEFFTRFHLAYPAPTAVAYEVFVLFGSYAFPVYISFLVAALVLPAVFFIRVLRRHGLSPLTSGLFVAGTLLCAYPMHFEWRQANIEVVVWCLLLGSVIAILTGRYYLAGALIGVAGAMKIFPIVYLGILLARRKVAACVFSIATLVGTTVASLWLTYPSIGFAWTQSNANMASLREHYILHLRTESAFDHSFFGALKSGLYVSKHLLHPPPQFFAPYLTGYMWTVAIGGILLYIFRIRLLPLANQLLCLCLAAVALPPMSFDYTLIHLYVPWALLVLVAIDARRRKVSVPGLASVFVLFGFLFAAESEIMFRGVRIGGQLKALALLLLWIQALRYRFPLLEFGDKVEEPQSAQPRIVACPDGDSR